MELTKTTSPDPEIDTPSPTTQPNSTSTKSLSFTNGALKRHHHQISGPPPPPPVLSYKECLKNHAATLGGHAVDGCGEFMQSPTAIPTDPTSLKCAACGCHRNFHRREHEEPTTTTTHFHILHHHPMAPAPLPLAHRSSNSTSPSPSPSPSPPPYYSSAPHMLLALSTGGSGPSDDYPTQIINQTAAMRTGGGDQRKRFRTKFSQEQKEKMYKFAERLGWKLQKSNEGLVEEFCTEIGVGKGVLKVWMHNNKHTLGKRCLNYNSGSNGTNNNNNNISTNGDGRLSSFDATVANGNGHGHHHSNGNNNDNNHHHNHHQHHNEVTANTTTSVHLHVSTNGSSSES